jgi:HEAT repeat protein
VEPSERARVLAAAVIVALSLLGSQALRAADAPLDRARIQEAVSKYDGNSIRPMGRAVLPELVRMYEASDEDGREKIAAVFYQLKWRSPEAKRVLMKDIHTRHQALRLHVQYALGSVSDDLDVVDALVENMEHDDNPLFRDKAACSLAYDQIHLTPKQKAHLYERLIKALASPILQVRQIALQALHIHTGQTKGFQPNASESLRRRQIDEWQRWLVQYRSGLGS